ncbi:AMP-binding protein [Phytomonospora sp. NPDC050363]|uniref:AMP-binding protein n=1 Tax=Phytomonospora sp. NPDC050363 TaxID=3155642 RepID=UPI0033CCB676
MTGFQSSAPGARDVAAATLGKLRSVPALAERYSDVVVLDSLEDLVHVPVMLKDDLNIALDHLQPRAHEGSTWMFQSGGTTGAPKLGYAPTGLYMNEVHEQWKPLGPDDLFVNGWSAGKMWGGHYLVAAYADLTGCTGIPLGAIGKAEYDAWLEFFLTRRVTAFGGAPSTLRNLFGYAREAGVKLPDLRSVLWLGEAWHPQLDDDIPAVAPNARRWGLYGSTETWVIGTNTPDCPDDTWHPLPSQLVHVGADGLIDFTSLKPHGLNPVLRYQTGDAGEWVSCECGEPGRALRLLGRRDGVVQFRSHNLDVDATIAELTALPGVARIQLRITSHPAKADTLEVLAVPTRDAGPDLADNLRRHMCGSGFGPGVVFHNDPTCLTVTLIDSPVMNERTGKSANLLRRQAA